MFTTSVEKIVAVVAVDVPAAPRPLSSGMHDERVGRRSQS